MTIDEASGGRAASRPGAARLDAARVEASRRDAARRGRRQGVLLWGGAALSLLLLAPFGEVLAGFVWGCPFKQLTGFPCPTCGSTRAALALARFDFLGALTRYPLPTIGWIFFIGGGLLSSAWVLSGRDLPPLPRRLPRWLIAAGVVALLANWAWSIQTGV